MLQARRLLRIMVGVPQSLWLCADAVEVADHRRMVHQTKDLHIVNGREPRISKVSSKIITLVERDISHLLSSSQTDHGSESAGGRHHGHAYDIIILNYYFFKSSLPEHTPLSRELLP